MAWFGKSREEELDKKRAEVDLLDYEVGLREETAKRFIRPFHHKEGSSALDFLMHRSGEKRTGSYPREIYKSFIHDMVNAGAARGEEGMDYVIEAYTRKLMQLRMPRDKAFKTLLDRWNKFERGEEEGVEE